MLVLSLCTCARQEGGQAVLAGRYTGDRLTSRGGYLTFDLVLQGDATATLERVESGSASTWHGSWSQSGRYVVLALHQVGLDARLVERYGLTAADVSDACYVWVALPSTEGLSFYDETVCTCGQDPGDIHEFLGRIVAWPVHLVRMPPPTRVNGAR